LRAATITGVNRETERGRGPARWEGTPGPRPSCVLLRTVGNSDREERNAGPRKIDREDQAPVTREKEKETFHDLPDLNLPKQGKLEPGANLKRLKMDQRLGNDVSHLL